MDRPDEHQSGDIALIRPELFKQDCYIGGKWVHAVDGQRIAVTNPATSRAIGGVPRLAREQITAAITAAHAALAPWSTQTAQHRCSLLRRWHDLIVENADDLAALITKEQGKPIGESRGEIQYGASFVDWFAEEAKRIYGKIIPGPRPGARILVNRRPVGVVGAITPWNFPMAMITRKIAPALAAGCTIVVKPSELTPFSAFALAVLAEKAGIPAGVINFVTGDPAEIGDELTSNPLVRKISFTGSTRVGKLLAEKSARTMKRVSMELGGNAPLIIFEDADIDTAVAGVMAAKFRNMGQSCIGSNRIYVHADIHDAFTDRLVEAVKRLRVKPGEAADADQGPLINEQAVLKVERHIRNACEHGAAVKLGGRRHELGHSFFQPTILVDMTSKMELANEETFGPVAALFRFRSEDEVIREANATPYGLAAYIFTQDLNRFWRVSDSLECGMVGVNDGFISNAAAPFGGVKESGLGREGSAYGIDDYTDLKYIAVGAERPKHPS